MQMIQQLNTIYLNPCKINKYNKCKINTFNNNKKQINSIKKLNRSKSNLNPIRNYDLYCLIILFNIHINSFNFNNFHFHSFISIFSFIKRSISLNKSNFLNDSQSLSFVFYNDLINYYMNKSYSGSLLYVLSLNISLIIFILH